MIVTVNNKSYEISEDEAKLINAEWDRLEPLKPRLRDKPRQYRSTALFMQLLQEVVAAREEEREPNFPKRKPRKL